jgi:radical SAM/Cys-rich protein
MISFAEKLIQDGLNLSRTNVETLQVNLGKLCNQACSHCHVEAGPLRTENMTEATVNKIISLIENSPNIKLVDLTGGAPEMNPYFVRLVQYLRSKNIEVIDRCNLTILFEPGMENLADFLADQKVKVVASLPCYTEANVDKQRGKGVFEKSIDGIKKLNSKGFGIENSGLTLDLVYNPGGAFLPGNQKKLEDDYKTRLYNDFKIYFNQLFTITNMPIKRFLDDLRRQNKTEEYMELLLSNFNPSAVDGVMCKTLLSVGYDGVLYDCDFNQMLELSLSPNSKSIWDLQSFTDFKNNDITLGNHCFGCTAGSGSSCGGQLT